MKKALLIAALAVSVAACTPKNEYRIHGYVKDASLNDVQVFLVPLHDQSPAMVDSVYIKDNKFEFKGHGKMRQEWIADIRLDRRHRYGIENLLIVTEPGDIYVTIGPTSSCYGTPQNDSLQVWKDATTAVNKTTSNLRRIGKNHEADSIRAAYRLRSSAMGVALGEESTLGKFLLSKYPAPKE